MAMNSCVASVAGEAELYLSPLSTAISFVAAFSSSCIISSLVNMRHNSNIDRIHSAFVKFPNL